MKLIKIVKAIGSFFLAVLIVAIPFMCALSDALNWNGSIKFILTLMTIGALIIITVWIYTESEKKMS